MVNCLFLMDDESFLDIMRVIDYVGYGHWPGEWWLT
jgi:hypothetical protein